MGPLALAGAGITEGMAPLMEIVSSLGDLRRNLVRAWRFNLASERDLPRCRNLIHNNVGKNPGCWMAHYNLAIALRANGGKPTRRSPIIVKLWPCWPDYAEAHYNLDASLVERAN
jgi:hypothetical protein